MRTMMMLYVAVRQDDEFELPCFVGNGHEVAAFVGTTLASFYSIVTRNQSIHGYKIFKINTED